MGSLNLSMIKKYIPTSLFSLLLWHPLSQILIGTWTGPIAFWPLNHLKVPNPEMSSISTSKEALTIATHNKTRVEFKGRKIQIFSDMSPIITLAKQCDLRPITVHCTSTESSSYISLGLSFLTLRLEMGHNTQWETFKKVICSPEN